MIFAIFYKKVCLYLLHMFKVKYLGMYSLKKIILISNNLEYKEDNYDKKN